MASINFEPSILESLSQDAPMRMGDATISPAMTFTTLLSTCCVAKVLITAQRGHSTLPMKVVAEDGDILTYQLKDRIKDTGIFRLSFRAYPWNNNLPNRQDFAYMKWF